MDDRLEAKSVSRTRSTEAYSDRGGRRHARAASLLQESFSKDTGGAVVGFPTGVPALGAVVFGLRGAKTWQTRAVLPGVLRCIGAPPPSFCAPGGSA